MLFVFKFPDIGEGIHEGKILEWHVHKGQAVKEGDAVLKVETDKVVADIPIPKTGVIKNLFGKVGEIIHVGAAIVEMEAEGEVSSDTKPEPVEEAGYGVVGVIEVAHTDAFLPATGEGFEAVEEAKDILKHRKALATPVARKMAKDLGVDINLVRGTGPGGRVMKEDIRKAHTAPVATQLAVSSASLGPRTETEELTQLRKTIISRMVQSKYTAPHTTAVEEMEVSKLVALRNEQKDLFAAQGIKLSYLPFIIKAVTLSLRKHKKLNCRLDLPNNRVIYNNYYNIGIAVDTPEGLVVPVIKDADQKSLVEIAKAIADLSSRAQERKLTLDEIRDGTFSITNYGSIAGLYGVPIINYPEVAILGVGRIQQKPVVIEGQMVPGYTLGLSMSVDHRIVDGADMARFLNDVMVLLANPVGMLMM
jgi:pyruvate dehydrogenase E2 component (dihydrolipoamide acetyltransferase)